MKSPSRKKFPKPVKVKKEKNDDEYCPPSLKFYLDDRLEMVKQIFGSLKPKTILNLTPSYLKNKTMEEIEESCLDELLRISTKRLQSIIDDTECPSDTESSCDDSDVQQHEEHISLEEISSDSDIEDKSKFLTNGGIKVPDNSSSEKSGKSQISVLELLELQARARAIRSQLALEPITKIEVDSDNEQEIKRKTLNSSIKKSSYEKDQRVNIKSSGSKTSPNAFLNKGKRPSLIGTSLPKSEVNSPKLPDITNKIIDNDDKIEETLLTKINVSKVGENKCRSSCSPDVIPIVVQPETLLISDASDIEENNSCNDKKDSNTNVDDILNYLNTEQKPKQNKEKKTQRNVDSEPEEGELLESDDSDEEIQNNKRTIDTVEEVIINNIDISNDTKNTLNKVYSDQDITEIETEQNSLEKINVDGIENDNKNVITSNVELMDYKITKSEENEVTPQLTNNEKESDNLDENTREFAENTVSLKESTLLAEEKVDYKATEVEDDDPSDDIISIEGGDLENEITNQLQNEITSQLQNQSNDKSFSNTKTGNNRSMREKSVKQEKKIREDIIFLESSCDDEQSKDNESWHTRYMKSSKVSKVLATSRLSKRVRDKIKNSKHTSYEKSTQMSSEKDSENLFISKHEDGSMDQYRELLDITSRT